MDDATRLEERRLARRDLDPLVRNAEATAQFSLHCKMGNISIADLTAALAQSIEFARSGVEHSERTLLAQANTLDVIYTSLVSRAARDGIWDSRALEIMRLALKAQNQCRASLESLGNIKNPSAVMFARQVNFAGHQQINNGQAQSMARAEVAIPPNELLERENGKRLDPRAQGAASGTNPLMATVEAVHGAKIASG
jgi:hypothetical protein